MEKVIKNNGEIISYTSNLVDEILRLSISITTDNDYSVDEVSNLIKTSIPQMINDTAGENIRLYHIKDINIIFSNPITILLISCLQLLSAPGYEKK